MKICPNPDCKFANKPEARFCTSCGHSFRTQRVCPEGHLMEGDVCEVCARVNAVKPPKEGTVPVSPEMMEQVLRPGAKPAPEKAAAGRSTHLVGRGGKAASARKLVGWAVTFNQAPEGLDFRILEGKTTLGADAENDIVVPRDTVSGQHLNFLYRAGKLYVTDKESTNGTSVNQRMLNPNESAEICDGDRVVAGDVEFLVKLLEGPVKA